MKYVALLSVFAILALSVCAQPTVDIETERTAVNTLLDEYVKSVETENMQTYAKLVAHDTTMVNFGGFGKPIVGWDALKRVMEGQNEMLSETMIEVKGLQIRVSADGKLAWATCLWNLKAMMAENPVELPIRCTWVLERGEAGWKIVHFHKSMPVG
ncbi:MAG: SgcJ/EcaC family oxidoreductase [bacterium]